MWGCDVSRPVIGADTDTRLTRAMAAPLVAHLILAVLDLYGRAAFGRADRGVLGMAADHPARTAIQLAMAVAVAAAMVTGRARAITLCVSGSVLVAWSALMLAWGVTLAPPVSLVGPCLGIVVGAGAWALADAWAVRE